MTDTPVITRCDTCNRVAENMDVGDPCDPLNDGLFCPGTMVSNNGQRCTGEAEAKHQMKRLAGME